MAEVCGTAKRFISWQAGSEVQPGSEVVVGGVSRVQKVLLFLFHSTQAPRLWNSASTMIIILPLLLHPLWKC